MSSNGRIVDVALLPSAVDVETQVSAHDSQAPAIRISDMSQAAGEQALPRQDPGHEQTTSIGPCCHVRPGRCVGVDWLEWHLRSCKGPDSPRCLPDPLPWARWDLSMERYHYWYFASDVICRFGRGEEVDMQLKQVEWKCGVWRSRIAARLGASLQESGERGSTADFRLPHRAWTHVSCTIHQGSAS